MLILAVILTYILISFLELVPLWRNKEIKQIAAYLTFMLLSLVISIPLVAGIKLPIISNIVRKIFIKE